MGAAPAPDPRVFDRTAELIRAASRPIVIAGRDGERPEAARWLLAFAEALMIPVLTTWKGRSAFPEAHPLALGVFTGGAEDDEVLSLADLIILFGVDPEDLGPRARPSSAPLVEIAGDLALVLEELAPRLRGKARANWDMFRLDRLRKARQR